MADNGELCPYVKNTLQTMEGFETWDIVQRNPTNLRIAPSGRIIGFDTQVLFLLAKACSYNLYTLAHLLPYAESGLLKAMREQYDSSQ